MFDATVYRTLSFISVNITVIVLVTAFGVDGSLGLISVTHLVKLKSTFSWSTHLLSVPQLISNPNCGRKYKVNLFGSESVTANGWHGPEV